MEGNFFWGGGGKSFGLIGPSLLRSHSLDLGSPIQSEALQATKEFGCDVPQIGGYLCRDEDLHQQGRSGAQRARTLEEIVERMQ